MLYLCILPLYLAVNAYIVWRGLQWLHACHHSLKNRRFATAVILLYVLVACAAPIAFCLPAGEFRRVFLVVADTWWGIFFLLFSALGLADLTRILWKKLAPKGYRRLPLRRIHVAVGAVIAVGVMVFGAYGVLHAQTMTVTHYELSLERGDSKLTELRVVLAADLHLGHTIGLEQTRRMVNAINQQEPDLVCFAGDMFNNDFLEIRDAATVSACLQTIQSPLGVYGCYGNHDVAERLLSGFTWSFSEKKQIDPRMEQFMAEAGITMLLDQSVCVDDAFYLIGRRDHGKPGTADKTRASIQELTKGLDPSLPWLLLDHQPRELEAVAASGVDLDLSGHTHAGQLFPLTILSRLQWPNDHGILRVGAMYSVVTAGAGVWGPNMRVGTDPEIIVLDIAFD